MTRRRGVPERGDFVWINPDPRTGHEQRGRRPAIVLSPGSYNGKVGLAVLCPITSQVKGYPFEVVIPEDLVVHGAVLADQVKNLDWRVRQAEVAGRAPKEVTDEVLAKLNTLLQ